MSHEISSTVQDAPPQIYLGVSSFHDDTNQLRRLPDPRSGVPPGRAKDLAGSSSSQNRLIPQNPGEQTTFSTVRINDWTFEESIRLKRTVDEQAAGQVSEQRFLKWTDLHRSFEYKGSSSAVREHYHQNVKNKSERRLQQDYEKRAKRDLAQWRDEENQCIREMHHGNGNTDWKAIENTLAAMSRPVGAPVRTRQHIINHWRKVLGPASNPRWTPWVG